MSNTLITKKGRNQKHDIIEEIHGYNICIDTREIFLHGELGEESLDAGVEFRMANRFLKNLRLLEAAGDHPIIIHQHTDGGDWYSGMMMYDAIIACQCHVIFIMHGIACSMGSIIPQAADTRIIMPSCTFMIHDGSTSLTGTHKQVQSAAQIEERMREQMLDIYSSVCINGHYFQKEQATAKKTREYIINKMNEKGDWWLNARETVAFGFADAVLGDVGYETIETVRESLTNE